jgi:hypothetical protein
LVLLVLAGALVAIPTVAQSPSFLPSTAPEASQSPSPSAALSPDREAYTTFLTHILALADDMGNATGPLANHVSEELMVALVGSPPAYCFARAYAAAWAIYADLLHTGEAWEASKTTRGLARLRNLQHAALYRDVLLPHDLHATTDAIAATQCL